MDNVQLISIKGTKLITWISEQVQFDFSLLRYQCFHLTSFL